MIPIKSFKHLYDIIDAPFVRTQICRAAAHKEKRPYVHRVLQHLDQCTEEITENLLKQQIQLHPHLKKELYDPHSKKTRQLQIRYFTPIIFTVGVLYKCLCPYSAGVCTSMYTAAFPVEA